MPNVLIVQRIIPEYRVIFFDHLYELCKSEGIDLYVAYGQEEFGCIPKSVNYERPWSKRFDNKYFQLGSNRLVWQPCILDLWKADLVICEQANRLSTTYLMPILRLFGKESALWGHGRNLQAKPVNLNMKEIWKRKLLKFSDYFFAYTESAKTYLLDIGYDADKIKNVENSIDVRSLVARYTAQKFANGNNIQTNSSVSNTVIYCGGLYSDKKIDFLLAAAATIRHSIDNFKLIVIGSGPDEHLVKEFALANSWVQFLGAKPSIECMQYFIEAKFMLMPAAVGLAVLDSFALETPIITTDIANHGPEFSYIEHGVNGVITSYDVDIYASKVIELLTDSVCLNGLIEGARQSSAKYSVENMATNFMDGIKQVLRKKNDPERLL